MQCPDSCFDCPLGDERDKTKGKIVWGQFPEGAEILLVGEAPGADEARAGEPFVGKAGKMLDEMLHTVGISRNTVAIANVVKCRPPENRPPTKAEMKACSKYLHQQVHEARPRLIVTLGNTSLQALAGVTGVTKIHGSLRRVTILGEEYLLMPTLHPSYVMRSLVTSKSGAKIGPYADVVADLRKAKKVLSGEIEVERQHEYFLADTEQKVQHLVAYLATVEEFAFDTETTGLDPYGSKILGISFSAEQYSGYYVPMRVPDELLGGTKSFWPDRSTIIEALRPVLENEQIRKICHHARFDVMMLYGDWKVEVRGLHFDTMIAAHLLDENASKGLKDLTGKRYVDLVGYEEDVKQAVVGKKSEGFQNVPLEKLWPYACADADATYRLGVDLGRVIARNPGLNRMMHEFCMPVCTTLIKMEQRGMRVDMSQVTELRKHYEARYGELVHSIATEVGFAVNPKSIDDVGKLLDKLGVAVDRSPKTGKPKTAVDDLEPHLGRFPILKQIIEARQISKNLTTYVDGIASFVKDDFCVHPQFTQAEAVTGRLSCRQPNMQNIKKEKPIQNLFIAREGYKLLYADYSQMELRFVSWLAQDEAMFEGWRAGLDFHRYAAAGIFKVPFDQVTNEQRQVGKSVNFAVVYGSSPEGLAYNLGLDPEEGRQIINGYFDRFPALKRWLEQTIDHCRDFGYVLSPYGRVRRIPEINSSDKKMRDHAEHQAVNSPVQGGASDFCTINMVRLQDQFESEGENAHVLVQVHDAIIAEVPTHAVAKYEAMAREILLQPVLPVDVPMGVDLVIVDRWGEAK